MSSLPLQGVRVVDLSIVWAGPHCTRLMADMGAQVIKVEGPSRLDPIRGPVQPSHPAEGCYPDDDPGEQPYNRHGYFNERNRNKLGLCLDLRHPRGADLFKRLVAVSDVLVENFSAGTMDRLGLGYQALRQVRPDLIMLSMPSFGSSGPESHYVGYGATNDQLSGLVSVTGYEADQPQNIGINASDPIAGQHAAAAILAALVYRQRGGQGQFIDLSHRESAARFMGAPLMDYLMNARTALPAGNRHGHASPQGVYPCAGDERWLAVSVETDEQWRALCIAMNRAELASDPRYADVVSRWRYRQALDTIVAQWTAMRKPEAAMPALQAVGVPAALLNTGETLFSDPQLRHLGFFAHISDPQAGAHDYLGVAWRMSATPGDVRRPAPCLGEHTELVLRDILGLPPAEIETLRQLGVVANSSSSPLSP